MKKFQTIIKKYNRCIFCGSNKFTKLKSENNFNNFYVKAIVSDLKISSKNLKRIKKFKCNNCNIIQNNPWFTERTSRKIYTEIYGQHNRGWSNLLNFLNKGILPNHGELFNFLNKNIKIKNYAEFNSPFMGLFIEFFSSEYKKNSTFYTNLKKNITNYYLSRQVAGRSKKIQLLASKRSAKFLNKIDYLKNKFSIKRKINKFLFIDNSNLCWGQNDNYMSVNSKSFASKMFDSETFDIDEDKSKIKFDLFGIFHTLDHTFEPKKVLKFALDSSKYVIVYCHVNENLSKQHLFTLTRDFLKYLNKNKIYTINLNDKIKKFFHSPELYFICSKNKKYIKKLNLK